MPQGIHSRGLTLDLPSLQRQQKERRPLLYIAVETADPAVVIVHAICCTSCLTRCFDGRLDARCLRHGLAAGKIRLLHSNAERRIGELVRNAAILRRHFVEQSRSLCEPAQRNENSNRCLIKVLLRSAYCQAARETCLISYSSQV